LHFLPTHKTKQKNAKELPSQRTTTRQTMNETTTTDRRAACNSGFAKKRVQFSADTFVVNQSLVLRINPVSYRDGENPPAPAIPIALLPLDSYRVVVTPALRTPTGASL
jgi:hypothetical protein